MIISFIVAVFFKVIIDQPGTGVEDAWYQLAHWQLIVGIAITTITWLIVTYLTRPEDEETLKRFVKLTRPGGIGWKHINEKLYKEGHAFIEHQLALEVFCMFMGIITVYGALFATGFWIYGRIIPGVIFSFLTAIGSVILFRIFGKLKM
jgi:hypothetical protein